MGNKKKSNNHNYSVKEDKALSKRKSRISMFAMFASPEKAAKTFLYAGIAMVLVGSYLLNTLSAPRWLCIMLLVIGVVWNLIAGLIYMSLRNDR